MKMYSRSIRKVIISFISIILYFSTGCVSYKNTRSRYSDQKELYCRHLESKDATIDKMKKYGIID
jgi:hypothetical protein